MLLEKSKESRGIKKPCEGSTPDRPPGWGSQGGGRAGSDIYCQRQNSQYPSLSFCCHQVKGCSHSKTKVSEGKKCKSHRAFTGISACSTPNWRTVLGKSWEIKTPVGIERIAVISVSWITALFCLHDKRNPELLPGFFLSCYLCLKSKKDTPPFQSRSLPPFFLRPSGYRVQLW